MTECDELALEHKLELAFRLSLNSFIPNFSNGNSNIIRGSHEKDHFHSFYFVFLDKQHKISITISIILLFKSI